MVPNSSRQLLVWSLPTLAFLLSLLWYRRKRGASLRSDPGGTTQDTASTSEDLVPKAENLQVSNTSSLSVEKHIPSNGQLCEIVTFVQGDIKLQIGKPRTLSPTVKEEKIAASKECNSELVLKEKIQSSNASSVYTGVPVGILNCEELVIDKTDTLKERIKIQETSATVCPVDKVDQEVCSQEIPVKLVVKEESKIGVLESSVCTVLESAEHLTDKISETDSYAPQCEGKEENETRNKILNTSIDTNLHPEESSEPCQLLLQVCESASILQKPVQEQNTVESLETSPVNKVSVEEISEDVRIQEDSKDIIAKPAEVHCSENKVQVLPLNVEVLEELKPVESVEKDIDSVLLTSDIKISSSIEDIREVEEEESISSVESSSMATTVMARKSSTETSTMEKHAHEDEVVKKSAVEVTFQGSESVSLECKLSTLELDGNATGEASSNVDSVSPNQAIGESFPMASEQHRPERDSANHSPADVMLASPSISSYSDAQSEGSSDSGKGCSDVATPPSRTPASGSSLSGDTPLPSVYEFVLPQHLVGRLIGRHGCFVHQIKAKTNASILIKRHPDTQKLKICAVEGTQADIESALEMIRQKFPAKRYPNVTLEQVCFLPPVPTFPLIPECLQLQLVEGVNNDVILSSLVSPAHFFLQQPTHPTFPALNRLNACMNVCYSEPAAPPLPTPTQAGVICVAPTMGGWYRAQVVAADTETDTCDIKFVDYGGYLTLENSVLRQIRSDFMTLPFQAAECYLANVTPLGGDEALWSKESISGMEELTHGQVLQAQVCGYAEDSLPVVYLYAIHGSQVVLVNQELVSRGLAEWVEPAEA